jgi:sulfur carrier protein ThiS
MAEVGLSGEPKNVVRLVRPGAGTQEYCLPKGATLADLLRQSGATTTNQVVVVAGVLVDESAPLEHGAVVTIAPRPKNAVPEEPWRATIPSFQDEDLFREYTESLKALGRDLGPDEDQET